MSPVMKRLRNHVPISCPIRDSQPHSDMTIVYLFFLRCIISSPQASSAGSHLGTRFHHTAESWDMFRSDDEGRRGDHDSQSRNAIITTTKLAPDIDTLHTASRPWHPTKTATAASRANSNPVHSGPTTAAGRITKYQ